ncbi:acyltransferase family protein [Anaeromyxobacter paludicola]|uniref:Acyltransferase n=1 Tax=Anaeromyxobacter paludicola TaxID=2918171 RepID=A0ABM7XCN5_9BACT|nr:acyltransferase [Anaeromyxobacter paludicola]BDG09645.1 acyltransferase [Anaeromyxobacter paludicola]
MSHEESARPAVARFYRPELDALRFLAFLMVFGSHVVWRLPRASIFASAPALALAVIASGGFGVDLFFVLSAYLITELLLREKDATGSIDVRSFYARRILRIWPLYFATIAAGFALQYAMPLLRGGEPRIVLPLGAVLAFVLLAGNWYSTRGFVSSPVSPLWSVSIEEQFYLLWPLWVRRCGRRALQVTAVLLVGVGWVTRAWLFARHAPYPAVWCNTFARLDPIAVGVLLATTLHGRSLRVPGWARPALLASGLVLMAVAYEGCRIQGEAVSMTAGMIGYPLGTLSVTLVFFAFFGARFVARQPLLYLGQISYGLYVFHRFALDAAHAARLGEAASAAAALALTISAAAVSYRWFERPFLALKKRYARVPGAANEAEVPGRAERAA